MWLLLENGANVDALDDNGSTPLHLAISESEPRAAEILLDNGANVGLQYNNRQTALHLASQRGHLDIMRLLLENGANVEAPDSDGSTPLHQAISNASFWRLEDAVGLLLEHGANINLRNGQGQTALHKASLRGYPKIVLLILNHGADVDAQDNDGSTPLHLIISKTYMDSDAPESSEAYHDSNVFVDSESLREVIKLLLEHGASVHRENNRGETPFQAAGVRGLQEITELLSMYI